MREPTPSKPLALRNGLSDRARTRECNLIDIPSHKRPVGKKTETLRDRDPMDLLLADDDDDEWQHWRI